MKWKVFYDNGSTYCDEDGPVGDSPKTGVQAVTMECREHGRVVCKADDFYIWHLFDGEPGWQGCDYFGLWDYLSQPGEKVVLFGRTIGNIEYREVLSRVYDDPYLPIKTALHKGERPSG